MLDLSPDDALDGSLGHKAVRFEHDLQPSWLAEGTLPRLTAGLPEGWIVGSEPWVQPGDPRTATPLQPGEDVVAMVSAIDTSPLSIRLYHLELVAEFRATTDRMTETLSQLRGEGGLEDVNLALFLAPPAAVTPAHPDRHHNLLFQLEGAKHVWVEDLGRDDRVAHHRRVVDYFLRPEAGVDVLPGATEFELRPGDALYIPPTAFHWTRVTDAGGSAALSVGFSTAKTRRDVRVSQFDASLRRLGWRPRPAGRTKRGLIRTADAVRRRPPALT